MSLRARRGRHARSGSCAAGSTRLKLGADWLDVPEQLVPVLKKLGERHPTYGVRDEHYGKFGTALIGTLEEGLGDKFTPELRGAWTEAFLLISSLMRRGAAKISGAFPVVAPDSNVGPRRAAGFDAA